MFSSLFFLVDSVIEINNEVKFDVLVFKRIMRKSYLHILTYEPAIRTVAPYFPNRIYGFSIKISTSTVIDVLSMIILVLIS